MRLYGLELKRVLSTRTTWIILAALLLLSLLFAYLPVTYVSYWCDDGSTTLSGLEAIAKLKEVRAPYAGVVTEEKLKNALSQYQEAVSLYGPVNEPEFPQHAYNELILPAQPLAKLLREAYADKDTGMAPDIAELTEADALEFYARSRRHLADLMAMEQRDYPAASAFALSYYDRVETPFVYYPGYNTDAADYLSLYLFLLVIACAVITAPTFSQEYQTQADDILRSTKRGHGSLAAIKIASALTVSLIAGVIGMGVYLAVSCSLFGWETVQSSLQMLYSCVSLPDMTVLGLLLSTAAAGLLSLGAVVACTLLLSSRLKNPTVALTASIGVCLLPSVLSVLPGSDPALWLQSLLPSSGVGLQNCFQYTLTDFTFLHIGKLCVWQPHVLLLAAAVELPLFILLAARSYCKRRA